MRVLRGPNERGQTTVEHLAVILVCAVAFAVGASLLPSSVPERIEDGYRLAVCKVSDQQDCPTGENGGTGGDDDGDNGNGGDDDGNGGDDQAGGEDDDGGGGFLDGVGDFFGGAADFTWEGIKQVGGVFKGAGEQGWETLTGLWDTVTNPKQTWEGLKQLWNDPVGSLGAIWDGIKDPIVDDWNNGNYGEAIGRGAFSVLEVVFGGKGLTKLGKAGKLDPPDKPDVDKPDTDKPDGDDPDSDKPDDDEDKPLDQAELDRRHALGEDPATGKYRPEEERAALEIEERLGITLKRDPTGKADWIDPKTGKTYDAVGSSLKSQYFDKQWDSGRFQAQIERHLKEKADYVPIDVTHLSPAQRAKVEEWVRNRGTDRVFIIGDGS